ncbi:MAG: 3-ketoacyl-CoA thiolase [Candidatus Heimdallarchaeota archaeon LC_3]|nr:MAG: 3-ketoacyl-CoA thiolase [Candidatus Heimdallarchaeota archaeon LC_3]
MTDRVAIVSASMTKFGEHWQTSLRSLASQAIFGAIDSVENGISLKDISGLVVGNASSDSLNNQNNLASLIADHSGLKGISAIRVESSDASGGAAIRSAFFMIKSGLINTVLVCGVEKMTDQTEAASLTSIISNSLDSEWEALQGQTLAGAYALIAKAHFRKYGTTNRMMAAVSAKNHSNATYNRMAQFRRAFTIDQILSASFVADPITLLDTAPSSDGAAAVILTKESIAKKFTDSPVFIEGSGQATDTISVHDRKTLERFNATKLAGEQAFKMSNINQADIKVAEVHDSFSIGEILAIEDLGFFPEGKGGPATLDNETAIGSDKVVVNPSGGLKAMGHPLGATGVAQAVEIYHQLRNTVEKERQTNADFGLTQSVGGIGSTVAVHVYSKN